MTNREIYEGALSLLAEDQYEDCSDYESRAPFLLSVFFGECREADGFYRAAHGACGGEEGGFPADLDENFPLHPRFAGAGALYLAALLVEAEAAELSDRLFARYAEELNRILRLGTPGECVSIRDVYAFED